jgi:hypothetical protein
MIARGIRAAVVVVALTLLTAGPVMAAPQSAPATPRIVLSSTSGVTGSTVTVSGESFVKNTSGTVTVDNGQPTPFKTTRDGTFTALATITASPGALATVRAVAGKQSAGATFQVGWPIAPETTVAPPPAASLPVSSAPLRFGLVTPGGPTATAELDAVGQTLGENPSMIVWYEDFTQAPPITQLDAAVARGATPMITWEPWAWGGGVNQPPYSSDRIAAGAYDEHIRAWGQALTAWGKPVLLRYGHEMNGDWYPWSDGVNGNGSGDYVAAWRHVHDLIASTGASNVQWVWSPNVPDHLAPAMSTLYPGRTYVDVVALDGYNWGTSQSWTGWLEPAALFGTGLTQLRTIAPGKPIVVAETASAEAGGSKAAWSKNLIEYLSAQPDVVAFVWFDLNKEVDWRVDSSASAAAGLRAALAARPTS